eukprot:gnl/TRDRNA2_/TRDRNA2_27805_c0_seq1.p1 gnl/TRDRNA2_/TRDRNA2_27805_c0~~gnl/TRDRNA2_/TRDRNA2_27805_c0_seq1.p1  ORF type:complete len:360 (-),score=60.65 gnl/TRDRNA2_/TRDRNA2_27805_c0_seq1:155-1234(-)
MRFGVLGVGGVGGWIGARLQEAGADVVFIARGTHGEQLRSRGLRLEVLRGGEQPEVVLEQKVRSFPDVAAAVNAGVVVDCCILGVKAFQVREATESCLPFLSPDGFVVTTQNGVEAPHEASAGLGGSSRVVGGMCKVFSWVAEPGVVRMQAEPCIFCFGEVFNSDGLEVADARSGRVDELFAALQSVGGVVAQVGTGKPTPSMWCAIWEKAVLMCSNGPVGALTRSSYDAMHACPETRKVLRRAMVEVAQVAVGRGVSLEADPETYVDGVLATFVRTIVEKKGSTNSTTRDVVMGKPSEIQDLSGAIIRAASSVGVPVPTHEVIYAALLPQERRARGEYHYDLQGVPGGAPHVASESGT